jgi:hypothetical protein
MLYWYWYSYSYHHVCCSPQRLYTLTQPKLLVLSILRLEGHIHHDEHISRVSLHDYTDLAFKY